MEKGKDYLFIVYFSVTIDKKRFYKSIINTESKSEVKDIFLKKIKKDLKGFLIRDIRVQIIKKSKYRGRKITDKQWERLLELSYPNTRHKLSKIPKNQWFKPKKHKRRNVDGTFKKGFVPWNKGLKLKVFKKDENGRFISSRDTLGRFTKGIQVTTIGAKFAINDEKLKAINEEI
tara:strand:+ start:5039 stop:5563 length:525 start_codon:yes stop_codon:yes gene_type:complete